MTRAALVAGHWPRRLGAMAGPFGVPSGSGDSPNGSVLQVELFVQGSWVDITSFVMTRDGSGKVAITRGKPDEASQVNPARCAFQLNNRDGRFSPRNPTGPYFGFLGRNQPLRVSVPAGNDKSYRFWGEVPAWPSNWDTTGTDVWVDVEAAGILRRLGQGQSPVGSALRLAISSGLAAYLNPAPAATVVAYWPCEDGANSASIASAASGGKPMTVLGTPTLSSFSRFVCSDPLPVFADASFTGVVPPYTVQSTLVLRFLLAIPSGGITNNQLLLSFTMSGGMSLWQVYYVTAGGGSLRFVVTASNGSVLADFTDVNDFLNGALIQTQIVMTQVGPDIDITTVSTAVGSDTGFGSTPTFSSTTLGMVTSVTLAPNRDLTNVTMGHVDIETTDGDPVALIGALSRILVASIGEAADDRAFRLTQTLGIKYHQIGATSQSVAMGYQLDNTLLDLLQECSDSDDGMLFELLDDIGVGYRTRLSLENQTAALTLSYTAFNLSEVPVPLDDDRYTRNHVVVTRVGGSDATLIQKDGPLSVLAPPSGVGRYDTNVSLSLGSDSQLADAAGWRLHLGTTDEPRYPVISVNLAHPTFATNPTLKNQVLAVRQGDRIVVTDLPAWMPPDGLSQIVLGFTETIDHFQHRITFTCSPESPYRTAVFDDATLGRLDTAGSSLAADASSSATSLSVATTVGPLWTTTDTPFDVTIGGERITVNGVSGASSPQTFSPVVRSVNGVVKAQTSGTDVRLFQPMILAL